MQRIVQSGVRPELSFGFDPTILTTDHASIVLDSINEDTGTRITTWRLKMWKLLVGEFNTHRVNSRNSASSRAVKLGKMRERILADPYLPFWWGKDQGGMQAVEQLSPEDIEECKEIILEHMRHAIMTHEKLEAKKLHKQITNRYLEPWMETEIIWTATETENMKELRVHGDAQTEFMLPSEEAYLLLQHSKPSILKPGEWHIPFIRPEEEHLPLLQKLRMSAARCARVSYFLQDGKVSNWLKDLELCVRLMGAKPFHASPFEHQGLAISETEFFRDSQIFIDPQKNRPYSRAWLRQGNFRGGFYQHRCLVELEVAPYHLWDRVA